MEKSKKRSKISAGRMEEIKASFSLRAFVVSSTWHSLQRHKGTKR